MKRKLTIVLLVFLAMILVAEVGFLAASAVARNLAGRMDATEPSATEETIAATDATAEATETTPAETVEETLPEVEETIAKAEVAVTKPQEDDNKFLLTFTGDCTFGTTGGSWNSPYHFIKTIGTDYDYPFANVVDYFEADDFTMINLEGVLANSGTAASKRFTFRGPTDYTAIMTGSSVEAVTLANNHTEDYGKNGYKSTVEALKKAEIAYVEKNCSTLYTTDSGLKIGLYAAAFNFNGADMKSEIAALRKSGAEVVVCAFHWGVEGAYRPNGSQQSVARQAIDAGADIVYGHHPHVLQKIEEYNDGIIYYSLGNFCFGGSVYPQDYDSAILQQEIIREDDGSISLGKLTIIPVSISSVTGRNNFQPTPLANTLKAYNRIISKLDGTFTGPNLVVDYGDDDKETEPPATEAPETEPPATNPPATEPPATNPPATNPPATYPPATKPPATNPPATNPPATQPPSSGDSGSSSGGESGGSSSGGESGGGSSSGDSGSGASTGGESGGSSSSGSDSSGGSSSGDSGSGAAEGAAEP